MVIPFVANLKGVDAPMPVGAIIAVGKLTGDRRHLLWCGQGCRTGTGQMETLKRHIQVDAGSVHGGNGLIELAKVQASSSHQVGDMHLIADSADVHLLIEGDELRIGVDRGEAIRAVGRAASWREGGRRWRWWVRRAGRTPVWEQKAGWHQESGPVRLRGRCGQCRTRGGSAGENRCSCGRKLGNREGGNAGRADRPTSCATR
jgi:hypothetical protein